MASVPSVDDDRLASLIDTVEARPSMTVTAPATDESLGSVPRCTAADARAAVESAREAQQEWADRSVADRAAVLDTVGEAVLDRQRWLVDVLQAETGKARADAFEEVLDVAANADYYAREGPGFLASERRSSMLPIVTKAVEHRHPKGVVALIVPWNYPLTLVLSDALPAILAGNAVIVKPAEGTPFSALAAAEIVADTALPADCFQVVTGDGPELGPPLIEHADAVGFTGSTETGRTVAEQAGRHLTDVTLELGGKNPAIVLADADIDRAAAGAVDDAFANAGQLCVSIERFYAEEPVFEAFRDRFVSRTRQLTLGADTDWATDVGSLQSAAQLEKVTAHVEDALDRGATLLTGGRARPDIGPFVFEPTILTDVPDDARLTDEETFGPVVRIESVPDAEAALERANDSRYGLNATVWSGDRSRGESLAADIECGTVSVNDSYRTVWACLDGPMGGFGDSGIGRRHARQGIEKYTQAQTVATQRGPPMKHPAVPNRVWAGAVSAFLRARQRLPGWLR
jgi:succinate-semialdehyde dehydrogenase/glutarate-semialdehyde dehydrogenase